MGSFKDLGTAERTLEFAKTFHMGGPIVDKMFNRAIYLGYTLKLNDEIKPLNQSHISNYITLLKKYVSDFSKKNYLISGNDDEVYFLTKLLLFAEAQTVTIIQKDEEESLLQFNHIKKFFNESELSRISPMVQKSLYYRLAKMDVAIIDAADINIFDREIQEEVSVVEENISQVEEAPETEVQLEAVNEEIVQKQEPTKEEMEAQINAHTSYTRTFY